MEGPPAGSTACVSHSGHISTAIPPPKGPPAVLSIRRVARGGRRRPDAVFGSGPRNHMDNLRSAGQHMGRGRSKIQGAQVDSFIRAVWLRDADSRRVDELVDQLMEQRSKCSVDDWLRAAKEAGRDLPVDLRHALEHLKRKRGEPALLVHGLGVDDVTIGPTPAHWRDCKPFDPASVTLRQEAVVALLGQSLGEIFGYASLQDGGLVHNLLPIVGAERDQSGHGSTATLKWHTEDAFTPLRADYLALMGLRNREGIATTVCGLEALDALGPGEMSGLQEARFRVVPDHEHLRSQSRGKGPSILGDHVHDTQVPILRKGPGGHEIVIDSVYMSPVGAAAATAFRKAGEVIASSLERVAVGPGEVLILDNRRAVHGREKFQAKFDGTDRWLLKASIVESLQRSVAYRRSALDRVLQ